MFRRAWHRRRQRVHNAACKVPPDARTGVQVPNERAPSARAHCVAALYDLHGNLPALDAAIDRAEAAHADCFVIGGDIALGPMPGEVLDRLAALGPRALYLRGNCDRLMVDACDGRPIASVPAAVRDNVVWAAAQLDRQQRDFLAALPMTITVDVDSLGAVLFCHATPRSDDEIFTRRTPDDRLRPMLSTTHEAIIVCGHTHMQFQRRLDGAQIVNAGSVGMPFGAAGAHWLRLGPGIELERTEYDLASAAARIRRTAYPQAAEFASRYVLDPPSEAEILAAFEAAPKLG